MSSSFKNTLAMLAVVVGYVVTLIVGHVTAPSASSSLTTLSVDDGGSRCEFDNVYIGDGAVRSRKHCDSINRGGLYDAQN